MVIELDPHNPNAYNFRGLVQARAGMYEAALEDYTMAIGLDPLNSSFYVNRGDTRLI